MPHEPLRQFLRIRCPNRGNALRYSLPGVAAKLRPDSAQRVLDGDEFYVDVEPGGAVPTSKRR
ncbi:hypothetical protein WM28_33025 [Burkholderia ubonensis]|nr:hypothetical protein WJ71_33495 [Burkholderia ubonensis]KVR30644.1 hypothetical protein WK14_03395 [Burkholderia ubonensis]KWD12428.1 hypothetical protein WL61_30800 [Burkholderia ubonensis]KWO58306.1 hypothetical protein WM28_33025 [Burkholderia ubonensis]